MPHEDGPSYYPVVSVLSLGSGCVIEFIRKGVPTEKVEVFVPERSILEFSGEFYTDFLHSIPFRNSDNLDGVLWGDSTGTNIRCDRFSCTFRHYSGSL